MVNLIKKCFHQNPSERPSFGEVKDVISLDYKQLRRSPASATQKESNEREEIQYADLALEHKYLEMRIKNREYLEDQTKSPRNQEVFLDEMSLTASYRNEEPRYLSLHDVTSSANPLPSSGNDHYRSSLSKLRSNTEDEIILRTPICSLSPGSHGLKRFFSYSGDDPTLPLEPEQSSLIPISLKTKSFPNPAYNVFLSNFNSNEAIDGTILSMAKSMEKTLKDNRYSIPEGSVEEIVKCQG